MQRIFFVLFFLFQAIPSLASGSLSLYEPTQSDSISKSKETKKIIKQLEDPKEYQKLLKTLKALVVAQEMEEAKQAKPLVSHIGTAVQWVKDIALAILDNSNKLGSAFFKGIDYFKNERNRADFWFALILLPIFALLEMLFERLHLWLLNSSFKTNQLVRYTNKIVNSSARYAFYKIFLPFLYPILFLPLYITNPYVRNWIVGFWVIFFITRLFILKNKTLPTFEKGIENEYSIKNIGHYLLASILGLMLVIGLGLIVVKVQAGQGFFLTPLLLMSVPLFFLCLREWQVKGMLERLQESKTLLTAPQKLAFLTNVFIQYIPIIILILTIPLAIDWVCFKKGLWEIYGAECVITLLILTIFMKGRSYIDTLNYYNIPKIQAIKAQSLISYLISVKLSLVKGLQWFWYLSFFGVLLTIWNHYFLDSLITILSHPFTKKGIAMALFWMLAYLLWIGMNWVVQFHTKPQTIKGKRREPTVFAKTFGPMFHSVSRWITVLVAMYATLESLGFDLKILVYIMSAFAFALSLGSQSLVKDVLNGFFALIDGSFAVGDVVTIGSYTGTVESLSLRAITLRHGSGYLQTIPFSEVGNIINKSRNYAIVPIDVATSYKTKIGSVYEALTKTAEDMANDPIFGKMILSPLSISGIDRFTDNAVHVSASIKILPDPSNRFAHEFNRRLKVHMDSLEIIPPTSFREPWERP
jgi:small-conductance mechanosensitive channel